MLIYIISPDFIMENIEFGFKDIKISLLQTNQQSSAGDSIDITFSLLHEASPNYGLPDKLRKVLTGKHSKIVISGLT